MQKVKINSKSAHFRVIETVEQVSSNQVLMYGVEGESQNDKLSVKALSYDKSRVERLVKTMNVCEIELCQFKDIIDDFLYDCYGICKMNRL